jgi:HEPN domain-containing protein/predicted nucleotidyltransferase
MLSCKPRSLHRYAGAAVPRSAIRRYAQQLARRFRPERVILFGSHAYGRPHQDSDVDLLVVMPGRNDTYKAVDITLAIPGPFPVDLIVCTPKQMQWRLKEGDDFLREIVSRGEVLYDNANTPLSSLLVEPAPTRLRGLRLNGEFFRACSMKKLTAEWLEKAEGDYQAARLLWRENKDLKDQVCFHCQQAGEKYLKALLQEFGVPVPRTHDLKEVLELALPHCKSLRSFRRGAKFLSRFAVQPRYPGERAKRREPPAALRWSLRIRTAVRKELGIR